MAGSPHAPSYIRNAPGHSYPGARQESCRFAIASLSGPGWHANGRLRRSARGGGGGSRKSDVHPVVSRNAPGRLGGGAAASRGRAPGPACRTAVAGGAPAGVGPGLRGWPDSSNRVGALRGRAGAPAPAAGPGSPVICSRAWRFAPSSPCGSRTAPGRSRGCAGRCATRRSTSSHSASTRPASCASCPTTPSTRRGCCADATTRSSSATCCTSPCPMAPAPSPRPPAC